MDVYSDTIHVPTVPSYVVELCHRYVKQSLLLLLGISSEFDYGWIQEVMDNSDEMDSTPFPNKVFALLHFILHSPRPIVRTLSVIIAQLNQGESSLKFIWFSMAQCGVAVPRLPGHVPPTRVSLSSSL